MINFGEGVKSFNLKTRLVPKDVRCFQFFDFSVSLKIHLDSSSFFLCRLQLNDLEHDEMLKGKIIK